MRGEKNQMKKTENVINVKENDIVSTNLKGLMFMLGCGRTTAEKIAKESGAVRKIGKRTLYLIAPIREYLEEKGA